MLYDLAMEVNLTIIIKTESDLTQPIFLTISFISIIEVSLTLKKLFGADKRISNGGITY